MVKYKSYSSIALSLAGLILAGIGLYFIFLRPSLLPEDLQYMGSTSDNIKQSVPGLFNWLQKVFWVMGGYIFTTGLLIVFVSVTSFRTRAPAVFGIVVMAGITSIGLMTVVNFVINSDFRWLLLLFTMPWATALILFGLRK